MNRRLFASVALFVFVVTAVALLSGCDCGGGSRSMEEHRATLHPGNTVRIGGELVGYCKHAWQVDPHTGLLRSAIVFGHPQRTGASPWGEGIVYDYVRVGEEAIEPFQTSYGCVVTHVYVHPDEGVTAPEEVHRASWVRIVWVE